MRLYYMSVALLTTLMVLFYAAYAHACTPAGPDNWYNEFITFELGDFPRGIVVSYAHNVGDKQQVITGSGAQGSRLSRPYGVEGQNIATHLIIENEGEKTFFLTESPDCDVSEYHDVCAQCDEIWYEELQERQDYFTGPDGKEYSVTLRDYKGIPYQNSCVLGALYPKDYVYNSWTRDLGALADNKLVLGLYDVSSILRPMGHAILSQAQDNRPKDLPENKEKTFQIYAVYDDIPITIQGYVYYELKDDYNSTQRRDGEKFCGDWAEGLGKEKSLFERMLMIFD